jgi:hypothetical protein
MLCSSGTRTQRLNENALACLWKDRVVLEAYQAIQRRRVFQPGPLVASLVVTPFSGEPTPFAGLY